jgi:hypothetical protein
MIRHAATKAARTRPARRVSARPEKARRPPDHGFDESHGYGPSHGGPSGPGDIPADPAPDAGRTPRPEDEDDDA